MFITPSVKKSLIVEQFQGNYLKRNIRSLLHLAALPILPDERSVIRFVFFCGVSFNSCEFTLFSEDVYSMLSWLTIFFVMIIILNVNKNF